jgi:hypothetical protein
MADQPEAKVSEATRQSERRDAEASHDAPQVPTAEEEAAAPTEADPEAAEAYAEYLQDAAGQPGEGRIP